MVIAQCFSGDPFEKELEIEGIVTGNIVYFKKKAQNLNKTYLMPFSHWTLQLLLLLLYKYIFHFCRSLTYLYKGDSNIFC